MTQAAKKLDEAAQMLNPQAPPGNNSPMNSPPGQSGDQPSDKPSGNRGVGTGPQSAESLPPEVQQYLGKPWGDLPGDVRTKIIQDLQAKYGEDYARVIKLYFEQLAERK
jgi:hypothetical protein